MDGGCGEDFGGSDEDFSCGWSAPAVGLLDVASGFEVALLFPLVDLPPLPPPRPPRPLGAPLLDPRNVEPASEVLPERGGPGWFAHIDALVPPLPTMGTAVDAINNGCSNAGCIRRYL